MPRLVRYALVALFSVSAFLSRDASVDAQVGGQSAQTPAAVTPPLPPEGRRPPAMLAEVEPGKPARPIALAKVEIEARIDGLLAETTTTLTFRNDLPRVLEGELVFPLPEGATISGYALDVGGELAEGVIVERRAARVAFEQEVRRGVDPGLVEWVRGNAFRTRVFPLPARGTRTVRVSYVSALVVQTKGATLEASYLLPLRFGQPVGELGLRLEAAREAQPEIRAGGPGGLRFLRFEQRTVAEARLREATLDEDLLVTVPDVPTSRALIERAPDGEVYFAVDEFLATPQRVALPSARVGLVWDASYSRAGSSHDRELALVEAWLRRLGNTELDVVAFRDRPEPARRFAVRGGDAREALAYLRALPYDGGTRLEGLKFERPWDYALLVSDGLSNLGQPLPARLDVPVFAVSAGGTLDQPLLSLIAERSGGAVVDVEREEDALARIGYTPFALLSATAESGQVAELTPGGRRPVSGRVTVTGRLLSAEAQLRLRFGTTHATRERTFTLRRAEAREGRLLGRFWAQERMQELLPFAERHHDELLRLGRRFSIVTPGASLLVLENLQQHLQHGVEPPPSRPELRRQYLAAVAARDGQQRAKERDNLERVVGLWQQRVEWWRRRFDPAPAKELRRDPAEGADAMGVAGGVVGGVVGGLAGGEPSAPRAEPRQRAAAAREDGPPPPPPPATAAAPMGFRGEEKAKVGGAEGSRGGASIVLKPWDPDTPYLGSLKGAGPGGAYAAYLAERERHGGSPAFYLDCGDFLLRAGERALGLRVLTTIVELRLAEPRLLRVAARRLQQAGEFDLAIELFEEVLRLRAEEPQSLRDLALALEGRADTRRAAREPVAAQRADFVRAVELLDKLVRTAWDGRFPEIEVIALEEANRIAAILERDPAFGQPRLPLDPRVRQTLDLDLRIALDWDTDLTDIDLWVTEPSSEKCYYGHALTAQGGHMSRDFTGGYGPEIYGAHRAQAGAYRIQANFYGSRAQQLTGAVTVQAMVITNFARPDEKREAITLRLAQAREVVEIGVAKFGGAAASVTR